MRLSVVGFGAACLAVAVVFACGAPRADELAGRSVVLTGREAIWLFLDEGSFYDYTRPGGSRIAGLMRRGRVITVLDGTSATVVRSRRGGLLVEVTSGHHLRARGWVPRHLASIEAVSPGGR